MGKKSGKNDRNTGKVREFHERKKVGTLISRVSVRIHLRSHFPSAGYGMTETSPGITTSPAVGWKDGSGGIANPMTQVKVVDIETGATLGPNQEGEICCLGPQNMKGYLNNDKATRQTVDPDGWLHTGESRENNSTFDS